jgi:hypothetical protein
MNGVHSVNNVLGMERGRAGYGDSQRCRGRDKQRRTEPHRTYTLMRDGIRQWGHSMLRDRLRAPPTN